MIKYLPPVLIVLLACPHIDNFEIVVTILKVLFDRNLGNVIWQSLEIMRSGIFLVFTLLVHDVEVKVSSGGEKQL